MGSFEQELATAGQLAPELLLPGCDWVHRRVQRVSYPDRRLLLNRLSVDFTVPADWEGAYVPISVLPKWPPLYRLDFKTAEGSPVPLLTSAQNGVIDEALMLALVEQIDREALEKEAVRGAIRSLTRGPETHLERAFDTFRSGLRYDPTDKRIERLLDLAAMLTDATLLWFPVDQERQGERTLCKLEYLIRNFETDRWHLRLFRSIGWAHPAEYIPLWHIGADANFHAELEAPSVLVIRSLEPRYYWFSDSDSVDDRESEPDSEERTGGGARSTQEPDSDSAEAESVGLRPEQYIDREGRLGHVYVAGRRPLGADLIATLGVSRAAIFPMFASAALIAVLVTAFYEWRTQMAAPGHIDAATAVLILIPALIGYVAIRPSDPPVARRFILGAQILSVAAAAVPLVMAVLLLRYADQAHCLRLSWLWPMRTSWLLAALLAISFLRSGAGRKPV
jgi:hypothetical protein